MDAMLKAKIPILNNLNEMVDVHGEAIVRVSTELARQSSYLLSFKGKTRSAVSEAKWVLGDLTKTGKALPITIQISSRQVQHSTDDDNGAILYDVEGKGKGKGKGKEVLADIISQQEQRAFLQEDNANRIEEIPERQFLEHKRFQIHLREEVRNTPKLEVTSVEC